MNKQGVLTLLQQEKVVAVVRGNDMEEALDIAKASIAGGIHIVELTYTTPFVGEIFRQLQQSKGIIGAGTVLDAETARVAILLGAKFIVSPAFNEQVAKLCNRYSIPYFPGCMTIKEIITAMEYGCDIVKLFPANHFKPDMIKAIKGPIPTVQVMPTGGVNVHNLNDWLCAGAIAVGIGSDMNNAYATGGYHNVVKAARDYRQIILEGAN